jgi:hypothetical protein
MKRILSYLAFTIIISSVVFSCTEILVEEEILNKSFLLGKWRSGTLFYKYLEDGSGGTWDTGDDVQESEAQEFTWTLVDTELTQIHVLETGGTVPKVYDITELTSTTLKYQDDFGKQFSFVKVQ